MPVQWEKLDPRKYEEMVSVLLSRLHPCAERIDGSGGDRGRDVQIVDRRDGSIAEAFEEKSFTGRMTSNRRRQVERSLARAAALSPPQWTMVVPIDPTPGELEWFNKLRAKYDFPLVWRGKTWLDEKMAAHPDIERYFVEGAKEEVIRLFTQLREEQAYVGDVDDAMQRLVALHDRLNEIDPYYQYELATVHPGSDHWPSDVVMSVRHGDVRVDLYPKYLGAGKDSPITLKFTLKLGPNDAEVHEALGYGLAVEIPDQLISNLKIDAPSGLGGDFTGGELKLWPVDTQLDESVPIWLDVIDGDARIGSCSIRLTEQTSGPKGAIFTGSDSTGWLKVAFRLNFADEEVEARFQVEPCPAVPIALLPVLRCLDAMKPGRQLKVRCVGGIEFSGEVGEADLDVSAALSVFESLAIVQEHSSVFWAVSSEITSDDVEAIVNIATLIREGTVTRKWESFTLNLKQLGPEFKTLIDGGAMQFMSEQDASLVLDGEVVPVGRIRTHIPSAQLAEAEAVRLSIADGLVPPLRLVPGESDELQQSLLPKSQ